MAVITWRRTWVTIAIKGVQAIYNNQWNFCFYDESRFVSSDSQLYFGNHFHSHNLMVIKLNFLTSFQLIPFHFGSWKENMLSTFVVLVFIWCRILCESNSFDIKTKIKIKDEFSLFPPKLKVLFFKYTSELNSHSSQGWNQNRTKTVNKTPTKGVSTCLRLTVPCSTVQQSEFVNFQSERNGCWVCRTQSLLLS